MKPTLAELRDAIPQRGTGAPVRSRSHYEAILKLLRERGPQGVLGSELYAHPEIYGRSPRNRISEARAAGHLIEGKPHGSADWWYRLIRDNAGQKPRASAWEELKQNPVKTDSYGRPLPPESSLGPLFEWTGQ